MCEGKSNQFFDDLPADEWHVTCQKNRTIRIRRHQARINAAQWAASTKQVSANYSDPESGGFCGPPDDAKHRSFAEAQPSLVFSHSSAQPSGKNANFDFRPAWGPLSPAAHLTAERAELRSQDLHFIHEA